eukprot:TRINITY_DN2386_c0_g1_i3.p4 TRINITY_DN2386_c0_g1~~TRINITY_DN2386_c0_g1_i3.p4  ORF type:complete len:143 (+),score=15.26 TRINITY_DN2386_c0_g1_i3:1409-1837(+)
MMQNPYFYGLRYNAYNALRLDIKKIVDDFDIKPDLAALEELDAIISTNNLNKDSNLSQDKDMKEAEMHFERIHAEIAQEIQRVKGEFDKKSDEISNPYSTSNTLPKPSAQSLKKDDLQSLMQPLCIDLPKHSVRSFSSLRNY